MFIGKSKFINVTPLRIMGVKFNWKSFQDPLHQLVFFRIPLYEAAVRFLVPSLSICVILIAMNKMLIAIIIYSKRTLSELLFTFKCWIFPIVYPIEKKKKIESDRAKLLPKGFINRWPLEMPESSTKEIFRPRSKNNKKGHSSPDSYPSFPALRKHLAGKILHFR